MIRQLDATIRRNRDAFRLTRVVGRVSVGDVSLKFESILFQEVEVNA